MVGEPKVRILADVSIETRDKLEAVVQKLGVSKKQLFDTMIDEAYQKHVGH